jgi:uncharacterized repeat protein (TIGR01451 family)
MKRNVNRVIARLAMFLIAIVLGAVAVSQASRGIRARNDAETSAMTATQATVVPPIPIESKFDPQPIPDTAMSPIETDQHHLAPPPAAVASDFSEPPTFDAQPPVYDEPYAPTGSPTVQPTAGEFESPADDFAASPLPNAPAADTMTIPDTAPPTLPPAEFVAAPEAPAIQESVDGSIAPSGDGPADYGFEAVENHDDGGFAGTNDRHQFGNDPYTGRATISIPDTNSPDATAPVTAPPPVAQSPMDQPANALPMSQPDYRTASLDRTYSLPPSSGGDAPLSAGEMGNGKPGPTELEGPQTPSLTILKKSPPEVQVGKAAKFHVTVRNEGRVAAHEVLIRDEIPHGTRLINTNPPASRSADGALFWEMGTLRPGAEVTTMIEFMPLEEGDMGSVATVTFQTSASARTVATRPQLTLEHTTERQVMAGDEVVFNIKLANTGSGVATNVTIAEDVPRGLTHYDGNELEYQLGDLQPGESRVLELTLKADEAGLCENVLLATAEGNVSTEDRCQIEIVAPQMQLEITGPRRRFLERPANYEIHVANPGTAAARNVELVAQLPRALKFVSANNTGKYDAQRHTVVWNLAELPAQEMGTVSLKTIPTQMGNHSIQVEARASMGLADAVAHDVTIDGLVALLYTVTDVNDPIEVGGQTTYEIHVVNQGSKMATNLRVGAIIPPGMEAINGEGPTRVAIEGSRVVFDPLPRLAPQADTFYKIHVKGTVPGDKRIKVQLISDDVAEPVTKEESTHVYADE